MLIDTRQADALAGGRAVQLEEVGQAVISAKSEDSVFVRPITTSAVSGRYRKEATACLMANSTDELRNNGGSPATRGGQPQTVNITGNKIEYTEKES